MLKLGTAAAVATAVPATGLSHLASPAQAAVATTAAWSGPPVIIRTSERVPTGGILTFYGDGFDSVAANNTVLLQPITGATVPASPSAGAQSASVVQADPGGHFIRVVLAGSGPLAAWISTPNGQSATVTVNLANPHWLSADEAYPGMAVYLCGRNLDGAGFGGTSQTSIRLVNTSNPASITAATITELSSYHAVFTTPSVPAGSYAVQVQTLANTPWVQLMDEPLTVVATTANVDPLGLGVAWTRDFAWSNVHDVTEYGAVGDGTTNDTAAIQAGITALANAGGGVLRFPAGTYNFTQLLTRAGVVFQGVNNTDSILQYAGTGGQQAFKSSGDGTTDGRGGIASIKFTIKDPSSLTAAFQLVWVGLDTPTPDSGRFFIYNTVIDMPIDNALVSFAADLNYDKRILFANNSWTGCNSVVYSATINEYVTFRDNSFEGANGDFAIAANRYVAVRNTLTAHFISGVTGAGGFRGFETAPAHTLNPPAHMYLAGNTVQGYLSDSNSGETFNFEGSGSSIFYDGGMTAATATTATVTIASGPYTGSTWTGYVWQILITAGRGLGQLRTITNHSADNTSLTIDTAWDVIPDATSRYVVIRTMSDIVVENNTVIDCSGSCQFYYDAYDSVISELHSTNTQGSTTLGRAIADGTRPLEPSYFTTIRDSTISGESAHYQDTSISALAQQLVTGTAVATCLYGTEILNNTIDRSACSTTSGGRRLPSGIEVAYAEGGITGQGILASLISGNHISNSQVGIDLNSGTDSTILHNNTFTSTTTAVQDDGSTNTLTI